ncbi:MAG TPA: flagellar biosynthetic protein FliO [Burkholderiaceae bacterium]|nr:flagellar biosynthetic protein FliO [Burkholderiaceae bacterium]
MLAAALFVQAAIAASAQEPARSSGPAASVIPFKHDSQATADLSGRAIAALLACLAVGAGAVYLLKRRLAPGVATAKRRRLRLIELQRVGVKSAIVLVGWDDEELLLAQSEGRMELLARKPAGAAHAAEGAPGVHA